MEVLLKSLQLLLKKVGGKWPGMDLECTTEHLESIFFLGPLSEPGPHDLFAPRWRTLYGC